jgi:hypothetical protein
MHQRMCLIVSEFLNKMPHRLPTDVLNDVVRLVDVYPVEIDARNRARVCSAVENWRHSTAGAAPVRPEVDDGDAVRVDLESE